MSILTEVENLINGRVIHKHTENLITYYTLTGVINGCICYVNLIIHTVQGKEVYVNIQVAECIGMGIGQTLFAFSGECTNGIQRLKNWIKSLRTNIRRSGY